MGEFIPNDQFQPDDEADRAPAFAPNPEPSPTPSGESPDFVPDNQFVADDQTQNAAESPDFVPDEQFNPDEEKYGTTGQKAIGYAEAIGRGIAGPIAPIAEEKLLGVSPQDIAAREAALSGAGQAAEAATFAGSMFLGTGEASLIAKAGEAAAKAADVGKLASSFISNTVQAGLLIGATKAEKAAIGQLDPHETSAIAMAQDGALSLLGGVGGTAIESIASPILQKIGDSEIGSKASQFLSNMGNRLKFWQSGGDDMAGALAEQMENVHSNIATARESAFGPTGAKARNIKLLTQEDGITPDQVNQHLSSIFGTVSDLPEEILNDPKFNRALDTLKNSVNTTIDPITLQPSTTPASASDVFLATDQFKRSVGELAKFGKQYGSTSLSDVVADQANDLYGSLKGSLENKDVWGRSAELQKGLNSAFAQFKPNNDNFLSKFTEKDFTDPNRIVSPGKVNTYVNGLGKPSQEIKQGMVGDWISSYENYANEVNALHTRLGIESPLSAVPTDLIKGSSNQVDSGGSLADKIYQVGLPGFASRTGQAAIGSVIGEREGGWKGAVAGGFSGLLAPSIEAAIGRQIRARAVPYAIRALTSNAPETLGSVLRYGESAARGAARLSAGINSIFKAGGAQAIEAYTSDRDKEKIDSFVSDGELNNQLQQSIQTPPPAPVAQNFAEGGEVKNPQNEQSPENPTQPVLKSVKGIAKAMPDHADILAGAKIRVNNYLNSLRPQKNAPKLAFDDVPKNEEQHRNYQNALDLAAQPLGILNHIKSGTLTPETLKHFNSMWPEIHDHISKKITERIVNAQVDDEKPSYKVRQAMSLFLGAPLDSTMTPQAIQAIQSVYATPTPASPPGVPPKKQKKNTSKLGEIPKDHYTQSQAAAGRATEWD